MGEEGQLVDYMLIAEGVRDNEELIKFQWDSLDDWLYRCINHHPLEGALIEGLAFGAVSSGKDFLAGLQWYFRTRMLDEYDQFLGTVPVSLWRSKVLTKEEQREAKAAGKDGLKWAVFNKLPEDVRKKFAYYVDEHKDKINKAKVPALKPGSRSQKYVEGMFDLADAFFIAQHGLKLSTAE